MEERKKNAFVLAVKSCQVKLKLIGTIQPEKKKSTVIVKINALAAKKSCPPFVYLCMHACMHSDTVIWMFINMQKRINKM